MNKTTEQKAKELRPIDDLLFNLIYQNKAACEELIRVILEDENIVVEKVVAQEAIPNLYGRGVRLDVSCITSNGTRLNIEVQRANDDDHYRRIRYNSSVITARHTPKSVKFEDVAEVCIIYITEFDIIKTNKTVCHLDTIVRETGDVIDEGLRRIIINTARLDGTKAARLMSHFKEKDFADPEFPEISKCIRYFKHTTKGRNAMCKVMEDYVREQNEYRDAATLVDHIERFAKSANISIETTCEYIGKNIDDYYQAKSIVESTEPDKYKYDYDYDYEYA